MGSGVWVISESPEVFYSETTYASKEEAIEAGRAEFDEAFWVGQKRPPDLPAGMPGAQWIIETIDEQLFDNNETIDGCDGVEVSETGVEELGALLKAWAEKHLSASWFMVDNPEEVANG